MNVILVILGAVENVNSTVIQSGFFGYICVSSFRMSGYLGYIFESSF